MHTPVGIQYFCIGCTEAQLSDFYMAEDMIFNNYGIKIKVQLIKYEALLELIKEECDRKFQILIRSEHPFFLKKAVETFQDLFAKSTRNHKLGIIQPGTREEVERQIYFNLLGSLNLACVFSTDGLLKTYGIQVEKDEDDALNGTLIPTFYEPSQIEITNVQPIFLDTSRCGILNPLVYFVARDFGTCIAQILLPGASKWSLAYLIQCEVDSVKICLVENQSQIDQQTKIPQINEISAPSASLKIDESVLCNQNYPFCRNLNSLMIELKSTPQSNHKLVDKVNKEIKFLSKSIDKKNVADFFVDVQGPFETKKYFSKLCREVEIELSAIKDEMLKPLLADSLKSVRKHQNFLNIALKKEAREMVPTILPKATKQQVHWMKKAQNFSTAKSRTTKEMSREKIQRMEREQKDGIITMPLLEPYLDVKWPPAPSNPIPHPNPVIQAYSEALKAQEDELLSNKQFGV